MYKVTEKTTPETQDETQSEIKSDPERYSECHQEPFFKSGSIKLLVVLVILAAIVGFFWKRGECYEHAQDDGFVVRTRYEIISDYFNGKEYEVIHWLP